MNKTKQWVCGLFLPLAPAVALGVLSATVAGQAGTPKPAAPELGCKSCDAAGADQAFVPTVKIRWKRLVLADQKTTDPRHARAEAAVDDAFATLQRSLAPLGVKVELQKAALSPARFAKRPLHSNRIWVNGVALEMFLPKAKVGECRAGSEAAPVRTIEFANQVFVDAPPRMIVHAGLIAAADAIKQGLAEAQVLAAAGVSCAVGSTAGDAAAATAARAGVYPGALAKPGQTSGACCTDGAKAATPKKDGACCADGTKAATPKKDGACCADGPAATKPPAKRK